MAGHRHPIRVDEAALDDIGPSAGERPDGVDRLVAQSSVPHPAATQHTSLLLSSTSVVQDDVTTGALRQPLKGDHVLFSQLYVFMMSEPFNSILLLFLLSSLLVVLLLRARQMRPHSSISHSRQDTSDDSKKAPTPKESAGCPSSTTITDPVASAQLTAVTIDVAESSETGPAAQQPSPADRAQLVPANQAQGSFSSLSATASTASSSAELRNPATSALDAESTGRREAAQHCALRSSLVGGGRRRSEGSGSSTVSARSSSSSTRGRVSWASPLVVMYGENGAVFDEDQVKVYKAQKRLSTVPRRPYPRTRSRPLRKQQQIIGGVGTQDDWSSGSPADKSSGYTWAPGSTHSSSSATSESARIASLAASEASVLEKRHAKDLCSLPGAEYVAKSTASSLPPGDASPRRAPRHQRFFMVSNHDWMQLD